MFDCLPIMSCLQTAQDPSSSWMMPDGISLRALASQLSISMVHPAFLLLNETAHVEYQALVQALGFGAATVVDEEAALAHNYYDFYIPRAFVDALEVSQVSVRVGNALLGLCARSTL